MDAQAVYVETTIPEDVYLTLKTHGLAKAALGLRAGELLAVRFYQDQVLSLGKAARLAGMDRWRFIDLLGKHQVPVIDMDEDGFAEEMAAVADLVAELGNGTVS